MLVTAALAVGIAGPTAYALQTASVPHTGSIPSAGPTTTGGQGFGGGRGGFGGQRPTGTVPGATTGTTQAQGGLGGGFGGRGGGGGGGIGGLLDASTASAALVAALQSNACSYTWVLATVGANNAAGYQLASGEAVMAIGGFNGSDPTPDPGCVPSPRRSPARCTTSSAGAAWAPVRTPPALRLDHQLGRGQLHRYHDRRHDGLRPQHDLDDRHLHHLIPHNPRHSRARSIQMTTDNDTPTRPTRASTRGSQTCLRRARRTSSPTALTATSRPGRSPASSPLPPSPSASAWPSRPTDRQRRRPTTV